jgi:hypothetical protein
VTAEALRHLLSTILADVAGHDEAYWLEQIGPVKMLPIATHIHCNWSVSPIATGKDLNAITSAIEIVRAKHPCID